MPSLTMPLVDLKAVSVSGFNFQKGTAVVSVFRKVHSLNAKIMKLTSFICKFIWQSTAPDLILSVLALSVGIYTTLVCVCVCVCVASFMCLQTSAAIKGPVSSSQSPQWVYGSCKSANIIQYLFKLLK